MASQLEELTTNCRLDCVADWLPTMRHLKLLDAGSAGLLPRSIGLLSRLQTLKVTGVLAFEQGAALPPSLTSLTVSRDASEALPSQVRGWQWLSLHCLHCLRWPLQSLPSLLLVACR